jgi:hypothetical protein
MMETVSTSENSVSLYETTWRNVQEDGHFHTCHRENTKSRQLWLQVTSVGQNLSRDTPHVRHPGCVCVQEIFNHSVL